MFLLTFLPSCFSPCSVSFSSDLSLSLCLTGREVLGRSGQTVSQSTSSSLFKFQPSNCRKTVALTQIARFDTHGFCKHTSTFFNGRRGSFFGSVFIDGSCTTKPVWLERMWRCSIPHAHMHDAHEIKMNFRAFSHTRA